MKQSLILTIIVSLFVLTIQNLFPTTLRFKKCPCGRSGPDCSHVIPQYCPPKRYTTKPTTLTTIKPTYRPCLTGFSKQCIKNKNGNKFCFCPPVAYNKK